jgi:hypothetical protein
VEEPEDFSPGEAIIVTNSCRLQLVKQPLAILLILIHLFNTGGYRFVFDAMEDRASMKLIQQIDNEQYSDDQLIEMRVALPLPYQTNRESFERYNGEIEIDGVHYNYVKRKVWNDTLILLCLPNHGKMSLSNAREQFFSLVNDLDLGKQNVPAPKANLAKNITTDFQPTDAAPMLNTPASVHVDHILRNTAGIPSICLEDPSRPPEAI